MRYYFIFLYLLLSGSQVFAQETKIRFESSLEAAQQKASQEGKVLFIDCMANYCGACRMMEREVFTDPEVAEFFNKNFISYQLNMDEPEGKAFGKTCEVPAYPTLIFMDEKGEILFKEVGGRKTKEFMELARRAYAREKSDAVRFEEGERDKTFVVAFLNHLGERYLKQDLQVAFNTLYEEQGSAILKDKEYWEVFKKYVSDRDCPAALDFVKNYKKYAQLHGEDAAFWKVRNFYANFVCAHALFEKDQYGYPNIKKGIMQEKRAEYFTFMEDRKLPNVKELEAQIDFMCLTKLERYEDAFALGEKCLAKADARTLCNWATLAERTVREKASREKMASWADRALETAQDEITKEEATEMSQRLKMLDRPKFGDKHASNYSLPI